jgi:hypothetical protein
MRTWSIIALTMLAPAGAFAQSASPAGGGPAPGGTSTYGPPAPVAEPTRTPEATPKPATTEGGTQAPARHRGRRKGSYLGADGGVQKPM